MLIYENYCFKVIDYCVSPAIFFDTDAFLNRDLANFAFPKQQLGVRRNGFGWKKDNKIWK
jgi:hypothetical protein